jgi:heme-degrading monooxygenase HmoA
MTAYTLARWRVKPGMEEEFVRRWTHELGPHFLGLDARAKGVLVRSVDDPQLFYSFGPWESVEKIRGVRADPRTGPLLQRLIELCDEAEPGTYEVIATAP